VLRKTFDFLLYSNIFIALCAVALAFTNQLIETGHFELNFCTCFIFFSTLFTYTYLKITSADGVVYKTAHRDWAAAHAGIYRNILLLACAGCFFFFFQLSYHTQVVVLVVALVTIFYGFVPLPLTQPHIKLRDFGLLKTIFVSLAWAVTTVLVPLADSHIQPMVMAFLLFRRFLFILALIMMFEIKDMPGDLFNKLTTIPIVLGVQRTKLLSQLILALMIVITIVQFRFFELPLWQMLALNASFIVSILCIQAVKEKSADEWFYLVIDGMMLIQFIFVYAAYALLNGR
jgi:4-hydroxybenzoate polyprenyltransferase